MSVQRYLHAVRAMRRGVELNDQSTSLSPVSLRVGVNAAMRDHGSLASLLVKKGIITDDEYRAALADGMEEEVRIYEAICGAGLL